MGLKEVIKKDFQNEKKILEQRYIASKFIFITSSLFFCFNFYFVGAGFFLNIFGKSLIFTYFIFIFSFFFYIFFFLKKYFFSKVPKVFFIIIMIIIFLISLFISFIFIIDGGLNGLLGLIKLYINF